MATACVMETSSMKKVPVRCESIFTRCVSVAMRRIISHPHDELGWKLFLCVPSLLLGVPASGAKGLTSLVRRRCERFLLGEWSHLAPTSWRDYAERVAAGGGREVVESEARGRHVPSTSVTEARAMSDAVALVGQAQLSRAMRRLEVAVLCPPTEEVFQALEALHPPRSGLFPAPTPEVGPTPLRYCRRSSTRRWVGSPPLQPLVRPSCGMSTSDRCTFTVGTFIFTRRVVLWRLGGCRLARLAKTGCKHA